MVEGGSTDETREGVEGLVAEDRNAVVWYADHPLGEGAFRNVTLRQALGTTVVLLDVSVSLSGDIFSPLAEALGRPGVGAAGPRGLNTKDCQHFEESAGPEVHAMTLYCFALPRRLVAELGFMDERFRFYRHLDLDFSFRIRSCGYRIEALPDLALVYHPHLVWERMDEHERNRRSRANFYRFYRRWHHRRDLYGSTPG
jgi:cysteinyl-tRNA synthetase